MASGLGGAGAHRERNPNPKTAKVHTLNPKGYQPSSRTSFTNLENPLIVVLIFRGCVDFSRVQSVYSP